MFSLSSTEKLISSLLSLVPRVGTLVILSKHLQTRHQNHGSSHVQHCSLPLSLHYPCNDLFLDRQITDSHDLSIFITWPLTPPRHPQGIGDDTPVPSSLPTCLHELACGSPPQLYNNDSMTRPRCINNGQRFTGSTFSSSLNSTLHSKLVVQILITVFLDFPSYNSWAPRSV